MEKLQKLLKELGTENARLLKLIDEVEASYQLLREKEEQIDHYTAIRFCSIQETLSGCWQPYDETDYTQIVRDWDDFSEQIRRAVPDHYLVDVYNRTRSAALEVSTDAFV